MGVGRIFFRGGESGEMSFFPLESKKTSFFAKTIIGKCQISKSRGKGSTSNIHGLGVPQVD